MDYATALNEMRQRKGNILLSKSQNIWGGDFSRAFESAEIYQNDRNYIQKGKKISNIYEYIEYAVQPVDSEDTEKLIIAGKIFIGYLKDGGLVVNKNYTIDGSLACGYEFQGSVTTDTHIQKHSDLDILTFTPKFCFNRNPLHLYQGNSSQDMLDMRADIVRILKSHNLQVRTGDKSLTIHRNHSPKIDIVPAVWDVDYDPYGIGVYSTDDAKFYFNEPFKNRDLLKQKGDDTNDRFRMSVRLLKNFKADLNKSENQNIQISSYDIAAIMYYCGNSSLRGCKDGLDILFLTIEHLDNLQNGNWQGLKTPDNSRHIFRSLGSDGQADIGDLSKLQAELENAANQLKSVA